MEGEEGRIVARLDPAAEVRVGQEAELWVDASRVHLFDPEDGRNLTTEGRGPSALAGREGSDGDGAGGPRAGDEPVTEVEGAGPPPEPEAR